MKKAFNAFIKKYGAIVTACAFAFVAFGANIPCGWPYYEPEEPQGLEKFKRF